MRWALLVVLAVGCRIDLDAKSQATAAMCTVNMQSSLCTDASGLTDCGPSGGCFAYIKTKIFDPNCKSSSCHSMGGAGKLDLSSDPDVGDVSQATAWKNLVGAASVIDTSRTLVVPGAPNQSYLEMMMQKIPPAEMDPPASPPPSNVQYMPMSNGVLCCQKLDLVDRWIAAGALND